MDRILIVDDSRVDRRIVGGLLESALEVELRFACDGIEALELLREQPPDLLISDLMMPRMDGLELVGNVAREFPGLPVLLVTGNGSENAAFEALRAGASSYVPKSCLAEFLVETARHLLEATRERNQWTKLMKCVVGAKQQFKLSNDPALLPPLIQYLQAAACGAGCVSDADAVRVSVALEEALSNALFHGNLEITSEQRTGGQPGVSTIGPRAIDESALLRSPDTCSTPRSLPSESASSSATRDLDSILRRFPTQPIQPTSTNRADADCS